MRIAKPLQIRFLSSLRNDADVEVVAIDPLLEAQAWALWESRADKDWSMTDCTSFVLMQSQRLTEAVTSDHHFEQAGFVRLLK
jgi:predicted nucleic acid-binding protein